MRKYRGIFVIASIALVALLALSLVACSDSNLDNSPQPPTGLVVDGMEDFVYYANDSSVILIAPKDKALTSVEIPACVTEIEGNAFRSCTSLESVAFAEDSSLKEVDAYAFYGCTALKGIALPSGVSTIGDHAFDGCIALESATYPTGASSFGKQVFANCTKLKSITFPSGIASVTKNDIAGCDSLESLSFYAKEVDIADELCADSTLKSVSFGSAAIIGKRAFAGTSITKLTLPSGSVVGDSAFEGCELTSLTLKKGVKSIGRSAFSGNKLSSIDIPDSVESIGINAFNGCTPSELSLAYLGTNEFNSASISNIFGADCVESLEKLTIRGGKVNLGENNVKELVIEKDAIVGSGALRECAELEKLTIDCSSVNVTPHKWLAAVLYTGEVNQRLSTIVISGDTVPEYFFMEIFATDIQFLKSNVAISENAFYTSDWWEAQPDGAVYVSSTLYGYKGDIAPSTMLEVKEGTTTIPDYAISNCESIVGIKLPKSVTNIADAAFEGGHITSVEIDSKNEKYLAVGSGIVEKSSGRLIYGTQGALLDGYAEKNGKKSYYVTSIGDYAFNGAPISSIVIPSNIESIGKRAFYECAGLSDVTFAADSTLKAIGDSAFEGCAIENIILPKSLSSLSGNVFAYNPITSISLEEGNKTFKIIDGNLVEDKTIVVGVANGNATSKDVEAIGAYAFAGRAFDSELVISASVKSIGDYAFYESNIGSVSFAEDSELSSIGAYAFANCDALAAIALPNKLTSIGAYAFAYCSELSEMALPEGVVSVGGLAFLADCFDTLYIPSTITSVDDAEAAFSGIVIKELTLPTQLLKELLGNGGGFFSEGVGKVTVIGDGKISADVFAKCEGLSEIVISDAVSDIEYGAFLSAKQLDIKVAEGNKTYYIKDNCLINRNTHELIWGNADSVIPTALVYDKDNSVIKDGNGNAQYEVMSIAPYAFKNVYFKSDFTIPSNVKAIQNNAFEGAGFDGALNMASSVSSIGDYAFQSTIFYGSFELPKGIDHIGQQVFYKAVFAEKFTIPSNVKSIGDGAFAGAIFCNGLEIKEGVEAIGDSAFGGVVICESVDFKSETFVASKALKIPASVRSIEDRAFLNAYGAMIKEYGMSSDKYGEYVALNEIVFEKGSRLEYVGALAFAYNLNLQRVDFGGAKITDMEGDAFYETKLIDDIYEATENNSVVYLDTIAIGFKADSDEEKAGIESITLKEGTTLIVQGALGGLSGLKQVNLPGSIVAICEGAFALSNNIEAICFNGTTEQWQAVIKQFKWDVGIADYEEYVLCTECGEQILFDNITVKCEECLNKEQSKNQ